MPSDPLQNLVNAKQLKAEPADRKEFENLVRSGRSRLVDACRADNSWESRFDLAYNAGHALSLALRIEQCSTGAPARRWSAIPRR